MKKTVLSLGVLALGLLPLESRAQEARSLSDIVETGGRAVGLVATLDAEGNYLEKVACFFVGGAGILSPPTSRSPTRTPSR